MTRLPGKMALVAILLVGLTARLGHVFNFYVYPDSYYYLMLAENLRKNGVLYGRLGEQGMRFPPVGSAIFKPMYPLVISFADRLIENLEYTGHLIAIGASVASIYVVYLLGRKLFSSEIAGIFSAILLAGSYNHVFWSGFIMGDSLSVLLLMLSMLLLLRKDEKSYGNIYDFISGCVLGMALLSRVTYVIFLPALIWLIIFEYSWSRERLATAASGCFLILSLVAVLIFAPFARILVTAGRASNIFFEVLVALAIFGLGIIVTQRRPNSYLSSSKWPRYAGKAALFAIVLLPVIVKLMNALASWRSAGRPYSALDQFFAQDPVLCLAYLAGAYLLLGSPHRRLGLFFAVNVSLMLILYYQVETWEFRYLVHLLPFLVLPGAFAATKLATSIKDWIKRPETYLRGLAVIAGLALVVVSAYMLNRVLTPSTSQFLRTSYPREISRRARPALKRYPRDTILITALPWPYYFHLRFSTWGIDARRPEKVLRFLPRKGRFLIVNDRSMRYHFPLLADRLDALDDRATIVTAFQVGVPYQYAYFTIPEKHKVTIYELPAKRVRQILRNQ